jgi:hypothetical protein
MTDPLDLEAIKDQAEEARQNGNALFFPKPLVLALVAEVERLRAEVERLSELLTEAKPHVTHNGLRIRIWAALSPRTPEQEAEQHGK